MLIMLSRDKHLKNTVINDQNNVHQCSRWAIPSGLFPSGKNNRAQLKLEKLNDLSTY
jgi:hypothetical protein